MKRLSELQETNRNNRLAQWSAQVLECRSSGLSVSEWCRENGIAESTYYTRQRRLYEATIKTETAERFIELRPTEEMVTAAKTIATVNSRGITAEIYSGADEATISALLRAMKSC